MNTQTFSINWSEGGGFDHLKIMCIYIVDFSNAGNKFGLLDVKLTLFDPREAYSSRKYKLRKMKEWWTIVVVRWTLCVWGHVYQSQIKVSSIMRILRANSGNYKNRLLARKWKAWNYIFWIGVRDRASLSRWGSLPVCKILSRNSKLFVLLPVPLWSRVS